MSDTEAVVVRFPPSPTGFFHIGGARTALFNYLFAKKHGGKILLRFEDTDKERSKRGYETDIVDGLNWLGLAMDGLPVRQSERGAVYKKYLETLISKGFAYVSKEQESETGRSEVIRFKNPNKRVFFNDLIRGDISFDTSELKDFVIAKSIDEPLYHVAVVVDDFEMKITHVIRGEDHISNTPRQILIQEAIGASTPVYAHLPLILAPDRSKLSKRHGAVSVLEYRKMGYEPEALLNYLALLGWNPGVNQEIFTLTDLIDQFDVKKIHKGGAIFDLEKLNWINREYLKRKGVQPIINKLCDLLPKLSLEQIHKVALVMVERISRLGEIDDVIASGEFDYLVGTPDYSVELLLWKDTHDSKLTQKHLLAVLKMLNDIQDNDFNKDTVKKALWDYATTAGRGNVLWPLRVSLSGKKKSPDPFTLLEIIGKDESCKRISAALSKFL